MRRKVGHKAWEASMSECLGIIQKNKRLTGTKYGEFEGLNLRRLESRNAIGIVELSVNRDPSKQAQCEARRKLTIETSKAAIADP
jgi:hypothetical protein